jgi:hypothetical protein
LLRGCSAVISAGDADMNNTTTADQIAIMSRAGVCEQSVRVGMRGGVRPALAGMMICGACFAARPGSAQIQQLVDSCGKDANALSASQRIESCTALIQSGGVFGKGLSWAHENRCSA